MTTPIFVQVDNHVFEVTKITHVSPAKKIGKGDAGLVPAYDVHFLGGTSIRIPEEMADRLMGELAIVARAGAMLCTKAR